MDEEKFRVKWPTEDGAQAMPDSPGAAGRAEVREPVRRRADPMTIEGEIAAFGEIADGVKNRNSKNGGPSTHRLVGYGLIAVVVLTIAFSNFI